MLSVSSSSSNPMIERPLDDTMYSYSMNDCFYHHSKEELQMTVTGQPQSGDQTEGKNGDAKKVNHNASERHRRKKINELYSSLRSLLPVKEQSKRMSIPTTVSKVLKYIPELQGEVEKMEKKKQIISRKIHQNDEQVIISQSSKLVRSEHYRQELNEGTKGNIIRKKSNFSNVSTSKVGDKEVVIQVSTSQISVPEILMSLEEEGFHLNCSFSSADSFKGRILLNLHLQKPFRVEKMECEGLNQKLQSMLENK